MSPDQYRAEAQSLASSGDLAGAQRVFDRACADHPDNAPLANSAGNLAMKARDASAAESAFARAARLDPDSIDFATNHAIALSALGRHRDALAVLAPLESAGERNARFCSVRASAARAVGDLAQAARWYDRSIALAPGGAKAVHGRARAALERGEADAVQRFERAVSLNQSDAEAWLGLAEALDLAGEKERARDLAEQLVAQAPQWIAALRLLAQVRLAAGEPDFASHFAQAANKAPSDPAILRAHITVLEQHDLFAEALEVAGKAAERFPDLPEFPLLQASYAGILGDDAQAEALFADLKAKTPERWLLEARYRLRSDDFERTGRLLDKVIEAEPWHINAWAVRDLLWRRSGDPRAEWLHAQEGLVRMVELPDAQRVLEQVVPLLHRLHDASAFPLGQSLRGGTQTRGRLLDRHEPQAAILRDALTAALEDYRSTLPPLDETHPQLRHRDTPWLITGSWSVRLSGGGDFHASHLHPEGIVSSALYCELPPHLGENEDLEGHIELGRPPPKLRVDIPPLYTLKPRAGYLALFPSTLYHGTRPFSGGTRMTVAFDVQTAMQGP
ncbi:2OG-Fe(II) oxygenase family protein [Aurantiacibacter hainanensis]|uniref:2OG-Fe(II) oxygenase family protein n=1 Tax=Aurantiacibacter hainanensis TaxID=3076114 RepID=UPI0030C6CCCE